MRSRRIPTFYTNVALANYNNVALANICFRENTITCSAHKPSNYASDNSPPLPLAANPPLTIPCAVGTIETHDHSPRHPNCPTSSPKNHRPHETDPLPALCRRPAPPPPQ